MGVCAKPCQSSGKSFLKWNLSANADKRRVHKSSAVHPLHYHTHTQKDNMSDNVEAHSGVFQFQWMRMRLSGVNRHKYGRCQPLRCMCVFSANSLCKNIFSLGGAHAKNTSNKQNSSFSFREREQYIQCAAGVCDARTAAGSEMQKRAGREDSVTIHKVS